MREGRSLQNMSSYLRKKWRRKQPRNINGQLKTPAIFLTSTAFFRVKNLQKNILSNWMSSKKDQFCTYKRNKVYLWLLTQVRVKQWWHNME